MHLHEMGHIIHTCMRCNTQKWPGYHWHDKPWWQPDWTYQAQSSSDVNATRLGKHSSSTWVVKLKPNWESRWRLCDEPAAEPTVTEEPKKAEEPGEPAEPVCKLTEPTPVATEKVADVTADSE